MRRFESSRPSQPAYGPSASGGDDAIVRAVTGSVFIGCRVLLIVPHPESPLPLRFPSRGGWARPGFALNKRLRSRTVVACEWAGRRRGTPYRFCAGPDRRRIKSGGGCPDLITIGLGASPGWSEAVAWMKRSNPGHPLDFIFAPGCRGSLHPGHAPRTTTTDEPRKIRKRNAERRRPEPPHRDGAALLRPRPSGAARLPAFHQADSLPRANAAAQLQTRFLGPDQARALPAPACPSPASSSQTGHRAGRALPEPPGSAATNRRPRAPHSLAFRRG